MSKTPKRNIRIDDKMWKELKGAVVGETISALIRRLLNEFLDNLH